MQKVTINSEIMKSNSIWHNLHTLTQEQLPSSPPSLCGTIDTFDYDTAGCNGDHTSFYSPNQLIKDYKRLQFEKLRIVKHNGITIPPISSNTSHILNLKQEFTFPQSNFIAKKDSFTQTIKPIEMRIKTPYPYTALRDLIEDQAFSRPQSFPMDTPSNHNMKFARHAVECGSAVKVKRSNERIGDGIDNNLRQIQCNLFEFDKPKEVNLEVATQLPSQKPVQSVIIKPKNQSTPTYKCKKTCQRPPTKSMRNKKEMSHDDDDVHESVAINAVKNNDKLLTKKSVSSKDSRTDVISSNSNDFCNIGGSCYIKLCAIVEQLQDFDWEVCIDGLRKFIQIAGTINWDTDLGARFIPIISRKLIDFFRSPRSNLCRTACQVAGEFFLFAKSTKRPEFDEMVDILLCKTADQNRFIQKDANTALDKMASCIPMHHSIRAICAKGSTHKNPIVRATTARIMTEICKKAGNEQIVGSDANPRTRKRILGNLAKFLLDKNLETRKNGEMLCRLLMYHKFFTEYFFKDIENNLKLPLRKILNNFK